MSQILSPGVKPKQWRARKGRVSPAYQWAWEGELLGEFYAPLWNRRDPIQNLARSESEDSVTGDAGLHFVSTPSFVETPYGLGAKIGTGQSDVIQYTGGTIPLGQGWTGQSGECIFFELFLRPDGISGSQSILSVDTSWLLRSESSSPGSSTLQLNTFGAAAAEFGTIEDGEWYHLGFKWVAGTEVTYFLNGVTLTDPHTDTSGNDDALLIGNRSTTDSEQFPMTLLMARGTTDAHHVDVDQVASLWADPFAPVRPAQRTVVAVPAAGGGTTVSVGQATETDAALAVGASKDVSVGQSSELSSALVVTPAKVYTVGLSAEADSAFVVSVAKQQSVGLSEETDAGLAVSSGTIVSVGLSTELASALSVTSLKELGVGRSAESDAGQAVGSAKSADVGQSTEADAGRPVTGEKSVTVGQSEESDSALAVTTAGGISVGLAQETDQGFAVSAAKVLAIGLSEETGQAFALTAEKAASLGLSEELDSALAVAIAKAVAVATSEETDAALSVGAGVTVSVGQAAESDETFAVTAERIFGVGAAEEIDAALAASARKAAAVGRALESDSALAVSVFTVITVPEDRTHDAPSRAGASSVVLTRVHVAPARDSDSEA